MRRKRALTLARDLAPYVAPIAIVVLAWPLLAPSPAVGDNFQFWFAGHLAATGMSPYDRAAWEAAAAYGPIAGGVAANTIPLNLLITKSVWLYPPQTAFVFAPFGALPLEIGVPLLHLFVAVAAIGGVALATRSVGLTGPQLALFLAAAAISQPFVISVRNGHPMGLVLGGAALVFAGVQRQRAIPLAVGMGLVSIKPQVMIPLLVGVLVYLAIERRWDAIAAAGLAVLAVTVPAELVDPFPVADLLGATGDRLAADLSTTAALARDLGGGIVLTIVLAATAIGACALAWLRSANPTRPKVAFASGLCLSLVLAPYVHDYDLFLCLPVIAVALALGVGTTRELPIAVLTTLALLLVPWLLFYWWPLQREADRHYLGGPLGAVAIVFSYVLFLAVLLAHGARVRGAASHRATPTERPISVV